jgi:hypothetical protein
MDSSISLANVWRPAESTNSVRRTSNHSSLSGPNVAATHCSSLRGNCWPSGRNVELNQVLQPAHQRFVGGRDPCLKRSVLRVGWDVQLSIVAVTGPNLVNDRLALDGRTYRMAKTVGMGCFWRTPIITSIASCKLSNGTPTSTLAPGTGTFVNSFVPSVPEENCSDGRLICGSSTGKTDVNTSWATAE